MKTTKEERESAKKWIEPNSLTARVIADVDDLEKALTVAHDFCCDFEEGRSCTPDNCQIERALAQR